MAIDATIDSQQKDSADVMEKAAKIRFGMLTTFAGERLTSRPMTIQQIEATPAAVWFFTSRHGNLAQTIGGGTGSGTYVNLAIAEPAESFYVSISGRARIVDDKAKMEELWSTMAKAWFPGGIDDPNLALVRMDVDAAEYWDSDHSEMVQMLMMAKSAVTGTPPTDIGTHGTLGAQVA
ncbi:MAG: pyridoxamine 5'-phosphate oxidase family protein [Casimicrobiaceae bacterium]